MPMKNAAAERRVTTLKYLANVAKARRARRQLEQRRALATPSKPSLFAALRLRPAVPSRPRF
jgi:hypothetical protein